MGWVEDGQERSSPGKGQDQWGPSLILYFIYGHCTKKIESKLQYGQRQAVTPIIALG